MILLKVFLAILLLIRVPDTNKKCSNEYDLINYLACETNEYALVDEQFLSWKESGFNSYSDLPTTIKNLSNSKKSFDLDSLLDEDDRQRIEQILKSGSPPLIDLDCLNCKDKIIKTKGFVPKRTIYSYSCPIVLKGIDQELYGIIMEQKTFEINTEISLKVYVKRSGSWELVYEILKGFS